MPMREPALLRGRTRGGADIIRETGEIVLALQHERVSLLVGQHVLAERGPETGEPLVDGGQPRLGGRSERRTGALEIQLIAFEDAQLLGRQAQALARAVERVDAAEQGCVVQDAVPMAAWPARRVRSAHPPGPR